MSTQTEPNLNGLIELNSHCPLFSPVPVVNFPWWKLGLRDLGRGEVTVPNNANFVILGYERYIFSNDVYETRPTPWCYAASVKKLNPISDSNITST